MNNYLAGWFLSLLSFFITHCSGVASGSDIPASRLSVPPEFSDHGRTMDSLQVHYHSTGIEYENWEDDDKVDESLTVCLINSKNLPAGKTDDLYGEMNGIARKIKQVVANPGQYKSYYIIFVTRDNEYGFGTDSHTAGVEIRTEELERTNR